jgi:hypothetical protein
VGARALKKIIAKAAKEAVRNSMKASSVRRKKSVSKKSTSGRAKRSKRKT